MQIADSCTDLQYVLMLRIDVVLKLIELCSTCLLQVLFKRSLSLVVLELVAQTYPPSRLGAILLVDSAAKIAEVLAFEARPVVAAVGQQANFALAYLLST